jgi:heme exporter protein C
MKKHWWKFLAIILLFYSLIIGMLTPLGAGVQQISPSFIQNSGEIALSLSTYNSDYSQDINKLKARIRLNKTQAICAHSASLDNQKLILNFNIPAGNIPVDIAPAAKNKKSPYPLLEISSPSQGYTSVKSAVIFDKVGQNTDAVFCDVAAYPNSEGGKFPFLNILEESIRNLFFHVPMWFGMMLLLLISTIFAILQLRNPQVVRYDIQSKAFASIGLLYGIVGILTGALWARYTWGDWWSWDVKQNTSAIALLIYLAYFVLRGSFEDVDKKARISAIYNIFAFATLIPLLYIVPRMVDSLHPGMGGNPAFSSYDLDNNLRMVFYPAIIGWILLGVWLANVNYRIELLIQRKLEKMG